jgi:tetratricopeptide (TPR) repeat protein
LAYNNRGFAWSSKRDYDRAIADYTDAIRLDPNNSYPYNNQAWLWATASDVKFRDGKKAVESATKACELSEWKERNDLDTLAASYAEAGDFDQAMKWQEAGIKLIPESEADAIKDFNERLALYRDKKPYHEPATNPATPTTDPSTPVARRFLPDKPSDDQPGMVAKLQNTTLYVPIPELETRFGSDPAPLGTYVNALKAKVNAILAESEPGSARGLLVAVGLKTKGRVKVWCEAVEGEIPAPLLRTLERELGEVPTVELKQGPAGFGLQFQLYGRKVEKFPETPARWNDAAVSSRSKKIIPPDDVFRIIWPD